MNHFLVWYKVVPLYSMLIGLLLVGVALMGNRLINKGVLQKGFIHSINMGIVTLSFVFLWGFNFLNMEWVAIPQSIVFLGSVCNALAIWTNGGYMPVHYMGHNKLFHTLDDVKLQLEKAGDIKLIQKTLQVYTKLEFAISSPFHKVLTPKTKLKILCDWIPWRGGAASIGDVLLTAGTIGIFLVLGVELVRWLWS